MPADSVKNYMQNVKKIRAYPNDPYAHSSQMLDTEENELVTFSKLVEKHVLLSNIKDDRMLRLYQNDVILLSQMFDMQRREPQLTNFFLKTYFAWRGELMLTRTKDGTERKLQATPGGYAPKEQLGGYGSDVFNQPNVSDQEKNFFDRLLKRDSKAKRMMREG